MLRHNESMNDYWASLVMDTPDHTGNKHKERKINYKDISTMVMGDYIKRPLKGPGDPIPTTHKRIRHA